MRELEWKEHPSGMGGEQAKVTFDNGYTASVLRGGPFYTRGGTIEIAVLDSNMELDYTTPITDDVLGYLSEAEAEQALVNIEGLPNGTL